MLFLIAGALYISFICWSAGHLMLQRIKHISRLQSLSAHLLAGLCCYCFTAGLWTLFLPTGSDIQHIIIVFFTASYWLVKKPGNALKNQLKCLQQLNRAERVLIASALIMLVVMAAWWINHPDTVDYHADIMAWIDAYRAIPGLANIQLRLGLQGQWYPLCSFLSLHFTNMSHINLVNYTVATWFIFFIGEHLAQSKNNFYKLSWTVLLAIAFCCYTQLRLTATSASPDFIAALMIWWIFYQLMQGYDNLRERYILLLVCVTAITIKLSVAVVGLIVIVWLFQYLRKKHWVAFLKIILLTVILSAPFFTRNVITTGHLIFPLPATAIQNLSWTVPKPVSSLNQAYIKAYARARVGFQPASIEEVNNSHILQWLPLWWKMQSTADRILLATTFLSIFCTAFYLLQRKQHQVKQSVWIILLAGCFFWISQAPDPRFGYGYLIPLLSFPLTLFEWKGAGLKKLTQYTVTVMALFCAAYTAYRIFYFTQPKQLVVPAGISKTDYTNTNCKGLNWKQPEPTTAGCRGLEAPCLPLPCERLHLRGSGIEEGFLP